METDNPAIPNPFLCGVEAEGSRSWIIPIVLEVVHYVNWRAMLETILNGKGLSSGYSSTALFYLFDETMMLFLFLVGTLYHTVCKGCSGHGLFSCTPRRDHFPNNITLFPPKMLPAAVAATAR